MLMIIVMLIFGFHKKEFGTNNWEDKEEEKIKLALHDQSQDTSQLSLIVVMKLNTYFCKTKGLGLRLEIDFVFPLSQQEQQE